MSDNTSDAPKVSNINKMLAAWLVRIAAATVLLLSGMDKFKSASAPYNYSLENYYGTPAEQQEGKSPKWSKIVNVVFSNSGLDNGDQLPVGIVNFNSNLFAAFGKALPWMFLLSGALIAIGFLRNLGYFLGGLTFLSLFAGQCMLPDTEYMLFLLTFAGINVAGLFIAHHDKLTVDGLLKATSND